MASQQQLRNQSYNEAISEACKEARQTTTSSTEILHPQAKPVADMFAPAAGHSTYDAAAAVSSDNDNGNEDIERSSGNILQQAGAKIRQSFDAVKSTVVGTSPADDDH